MATLNVTNSNLDIVVFDPKEMPGILDLRSVGYYKIKQGILHQNLSTYYRFESADTLCEQFNQFIKHIKERKKRENEREIFMVRTQ